MSIGHASLFSQILSLISRHEFAGHVRSLKADRHSKGFSCWDQFVAMLFCQLAQAKSLREISQGLRSCLGKLRHLGLREAPKRSTLSYANAHRSFEVYQRTFYDLLASCQQIAPGKKFRFRNKLLTLDATLIDLCARVFDWARFWRTKGAVKLHLLLDHDGYLPTFAHITEARVYEVNIARTLSFPTGSILAIDKAYYDFKLFSKWTEEGVWFVTRLKKNAIYHVVEERPVPMTGHILADELIKFAEHRSVKKCPYVFRRVVVWDPEKNKEIVFLTNHLKFGATTIARIYRDRWQIELFFKALKQNLKVKTFVGTSANALRIQIWTALIAMLMLKYLKFKSRLNWALSNLVALVRWNLFTYRDLWIWLNNPFETPPQPPGPNQLALAGLELDSRGGIKR
jgi:hypothetical protein